MTIGLISINVPQYKPRIRISYTALPVVMMSGTERKLASVQ